MMLSRSLIALWLATSTSLIAVEATAATVDLPRKAPVPEPSERPTPSPERAPATIPIPTPSPGGPAAGEKPPSEDMPIPSEPRSAEKPRMPLPAEEAACRQRLTALGVQFEVGEARQDERSGCSLPYPLMVKTLGPAVGLEPKAEINCPMAESAAHFMAGTVAPTARSQLGAGLKSVQQASAYVCRPRHNRQKMSEHAFGNALDIASFTLTDGRRIDVGATPDGEGAKKFLAEVRKAACGPFKTVLGPGSDADHATHFHFDLEPRRNGGTFCQ